jgi:hypothetical protein
MVAEAVQAATDRIIGLLPVHVLALRAMMMDRVAVVTALLLVMHPTIDADQVRKRHH